MMVSKHEIRTMKKEEKDKERRAIEESKLKKKKSKNLINYCLVLVVIIVIGYFIYSLFGSIKVDNPYTNQPVHWHADLHVEACGSPQDLPKPVGQGHLGSPLLHTHDDGRIHIEGVILRAGDISLGNYLDNIGVKFNSERIFDYENDGMCNSNENNKVKMFVNGKENFEFRNYIIKDGDNIIIKYE